MCLWFPLGHFKSGVSVSVGVDVGVSVGVDVGVSVRVGFDDHWR